MRSGAVSCAASGIRVESLDTLLTGNGQMRVSEEELTLRVG